MNSNKFINKQHFFEIYFGRAPRVGLSVAIFFLPQAQHKKRISTTIPHAKRITNNTKFFI